MSKWFGRNQTSNLTLEERFWEKVDRTPDNNGCMNWIAHYDHKGYGAIRVGKQMVHAHRVAWILTNGDVPKGLMVLHKCDNRKCVNPDHLFLGTNEDNMKDMARKGRARNVPVYGEDNPNTRLSNKDVKEIKKKYDTGEYTYFQLADEYGVTYQHIGAIIKGVRRAKT